VAALLHPQGQESPRNFTLFDAIVSVAAVGLALAFARTHLAYAWANLCAIPFRGPAGWAGVWAYLRTRTDVTGSIVMYTFVSMEALLLSSTLGARLNIHGWSRIVPWFSPGLGLSAAAQPRARTIPRQLAPALLIRRQIFRRLWVRQISCHSADTFSMPRKRNLRIPRADFVMPNTGSTMCFRAA
jgi:hypothetical protein